MIGIPMYTTILTLHKQGISGRQIAKLTGHNRKTVGRIIKTFNSNASESPKKYNRKSKLGEWHEDILRLLESNLSRVRIHEELRARGCLFSYPSLTRYVKNLKTTSNLCIRFNTAPAEEAQVDFGNIGKRYDPSGKPAQSLYF